MGKWQTTTETTTTQAVKRETIASLTKKLSKLRQETTDALSAAADRCEAIDARLDGIEHRLDRLETCEPTPAPVEPEPEETAPAEESVEQIEAPQQRVSKKGYIPSAPWPEYNGRPFKWPSEAMQASRDGDFTIRHYWLNEDGSYGEEIIGKEMNFLTR
ncbi:hypothetical protein IKF67_02415 [Candidatus Saccharibacteria bacterium]|nr:hypothetical protein [Candidatus Saccharibacteria bacterium]